MVQQYSKYVVHCTSLLPAFSEFFVPLVFNPFEPFLLGEKRVPTMLVTIRRLGFHHRYLLRCKPVHFTAFLFVSFPFFRRQNILNFKKLNFLLIREKGVAFICFFLLSSLFPSLVSNKPYRPTTHFASGE